MNFAMIIDITEDTNMFAVAGNYEAVRFFETREQADSYANTYFVKYPYERGNLYVFEVLSAVKQKDPVVDIEVLSVEDIKKIATYTDCNCNDNKLIESNLK